MKYRLTFFADGVTTLECDCIVKNEQEKGLLCSLLYSIITVYNVFAGRNKVTLSFTVIGQSEM
jgi:hypothetical protein